MKAVLPIIFVYCFLFIPRIAQAKEWHGIVPLHSTRADVHQLLDTAKKWAEDSYTASYEIDGDSIAIFYSRGPCEKGLPGGWNVPANTVVKIFINLSERSKISVADLLTDKRPYTQKVFKQNVLTESGVPNPSHIYYIDEEEGVEYRSYDGKINTVVYSPAAKERPLSCGDYQYAASVPPGAKPDDQAGIIEIYRNVYWETEKQILDYLTVELEAYKNEHPDPKVYLVAYAGRRSRPGEAQARADCARNYLVSSRGFAPEAVMAVDGGYREELNVELVVGSKNGYPPLLRPTVSPGRVEIAGSKVTGCSDVNVPKPQAPAIDAAVNLKQPLLDRTMGRWRILNVIFTQMGPDDTPPFEISEIRTAKGQKIISHLPFVADDDWSRGLTITLKNTSALPLTEASVCFQPPVENMQDPLLVCPSYGKGADAVVGDDIAKGDQSLTEVIGPGQSFQLKVNNQQYSSLMKYSRGKTASTKVADLDKVDQIVLYISRAVLSDGKAWSMGQYCDKHFWDVYQ